MKIQLFTVAAALLMTMHSAAFAERVPLFTTSTGTTLNEISDLPNSPVGSSYVLNTTSWYDPAQVAVSYLSSGDRVEQVLGSSNWSFILPVPNSGTIGLGDGHSINSSITARFSGTSTHAVDLTFEYFSVGNDGQRKPHLNVSYHIGLTSDNANLAALLGAGSEFSFGPSANATGAVTFFDFWTDQPTGTVLLDVARGDVLIAVPEPANFAMLGVGFGLIALISRRRLTQAGRL